jgi:hypothetical protein
MSYNRSILRSARKQLKGRTQLKRIDTGETVFMEPLDYHGGRCARHLVAKVVGKSQLTEAHWLHQFENGHTESFPIELYKVILAEAQQTSPTPGVRITMYWSDIWSWNSKLGELVEKIGYIAIQRFLQVDFQGRFRFPPDWSIHEINFRGETIFGVRMPRDAK